MTCVPSTSKSGSALALPSLPAIRQPVLGYKVQCPVLEPLPVRSTRKYHRAAQSNRGFAFALFYAVMNIAALSVGIVLDFFRITIKRGLDIASLPNTSILNNGMRLFILTGKSRPGLFVQTGVFSRYICMWKRHGRLPCCRSDMYA